MNAIPQMSSAEKKANEARIKSTVADVLDKCELDYDTMLAYILYFEFGFGETRLKRLFNLIVKERAEMKKFYCDSPDDDTHYYAMRDQLKRKGIDIAAIKKEVENS